MILNLQQQQQKSRGNKFSKIFQNKNLTNKF